MASPTSIMTAPQRIHPPPHVSPLDTRQFRALTLPNSLRVLLIFDHLSERAAVSMDVAVGSQSDPPHLPGLAHFLEHMLFLGTKRYPNEESYKKFLAENGGYSNAYTASENTNYHFAMVSKKGTSKLKEGLDRFAQFFLGPLFTESATERELNAVDSEHQRNMQSDGWRGRQVFRSCSNPDHPLSRFTTGSKETLWDKPTASGINVREALIDFHNKYYSANLMSLCVVAPHDLDTLQDWVVSLFSDIRNNNVPHPCDEFKDIPIRLDHQRGRRFYVETVNDVRNIDISWDLPTCIPLYRSMPNRLICNLVSDEGKGSILSLLKALDWADCVDAGVSNCMHFSTLCVSVSLTKKGIDHIDDIVRIIYDYIWLLKKDGVPKWFYEEEKQVAANSFHFRERESPYNLATSLAEAMQYYPTEEYMSAWWLYKEFDPEKVSQVLDLLTPERGNLFIAGHFVRAKTTETERWYGAKYHVEPIEKSTLSSWSLCEPNEALSLPEPNHLIPSDFTIIGEQLGIEQDDTEGPECIFTNEYMEVHHKLDRSFNRPKVTVAMEFKTSMANQSPWHAAMFDIYQELLDDSLVEYYSVVARAGFGFSFASMSTGLRLILSGYSDGIEKLLRDVTDKMKSFKPDPTRFEMIRDNLERGLMNFAKSSPSSHASVRVGSLLMEPTWSVEDQLRFYRDGSINFDSLAKFSQDVLSRVFVTAMAYGNITESAFLEIMHSVCNTIAFAPLPEVERSRGRIVQLPVGHHLFSRQAHPNPDDKNSAIEVYYQLKQLGDFKSDVIYEVLSDILDEPAFHELRTVQQLGYMVDASLSYHDSVGGFQISIQSTVASPDELLRRIDAFLIDVRKNLIEEMSDEKFQEYVNALITNKAEPDRRLSSRAWRFWSELSCGYLQYDRSQQELEALRTVTKEDVCAVFDDWISRDGTNTRRIVSQVFGNQHPFSSREELPKGAVDITNTAAFRRQNALFPVAGVHRSERSVLELWSTETASPQSCPMGAGDNKVA
eukprot:GFKZ01003943.1.p1 GENE.GFKZ01003943.1~~GFKZ01003943.1.p1  ORF type:complete len:1005 (+),score=138.94 GFKZ01003943.1:271-3285(+)